MNLPDARDHGARDPIETTPLAEHQHVYGATVVQADEMAAHTADAARRVEALAGQAGIDLVADRASQDAVAARFNAEAAAARVRRAAEAAAHSARQAEEDPSAPDALDRAEAIKAVVDRTAAELEEETARQADDVAKWVAVTADHVADARETLDQAIEAQVVATAAAAQTRALADAARAATRPT